MLAPSASPPPSGAFRHSSFRRFVAASALANVGAQMLGVAVGWQIYSLTHSAMDLGYVGLVQFVPSVGLSLPAGAVVDRLDRARTLAACHALLAACALALLAIVVGGVRSVAPVYAVLFVVGVAGAFEAPAGQALVPTLVPAADLANAVTWTATVWQVATVIGPALGGALSGAPHGAVSAYAVCAGVLAAAAVLVGTLRDGVAPAANTERRWTGVLAGARYVWARPVLFASVTLDLFAVLLGGATALLPVYASDVLHVGARGLGVLRSAPALGAAAMAIALTVRPLTRRAGPALLGCVAIFGGATVVFGISRDLRLSLLSLVVLGAADMVSVVVRSTLIQLRTPDDMRGRVGAVGMMFVAASSSLGEWESGATAAWLGAVPAVVLGGIGTMVVVAITAIASPALRGVDRLDGAGGTED